MEQTSKQKIKEIVSEFFEKMGWEQGPKEIELREGVVSFSLNLDNPRALIGRHGQVIASIQRLLAKILSKYSGERFFVDFDVNDYKKNKAEYLKKIAEESADEVLLSRREKILFPMSAYERRIIHLCLSGRPGIITESRGEEPDRKIVIKPETA